MIVLRGFLMFIPKLYALELAPGIQHLLGEGQNPIDFQAAILDSDDSEVFETFLEVVSKTIGPINFKCCTSHLYGGGQNPVDCQAACMDFKVIESKRSHANSH